MTKAKKYTGVRGSRRIWRDYTRSSRPMRKREKEAFINQVKVHGKLNSFEEFCCYGYLYTQDLVVFTPCFYPCDRPNLYEHGDNIQYYMQEFNKHRFYTNWSQPSEEGQRFGYMSGGKIVWSDTYNQKANVFGWMLNTTASKMYNTLKDDPRITVKTSNTHDKLQQIVYEECKYKLFGDIDYSNLTYIQFYDNEYNDDQYLFKTILSLLTEIHKPLRLSRYPDLLMLSKRPSKWE